MTLAERRSTIAGTIVAALLLAVLATLLLGVHRRCPECQGAGSVLFFRCPTCHGAGEITVWRELTFN